MDIKIRRNNASHLKESKRKKHFQNVFDGNIALKLLSFALSCL